MGFPENVLARDERVEQSLHPHWMTVAGACFLGVLFACLGVLIAKFTPASGAWDLVQWIAIGLLVVLAFPFVLWPILRWRTTHYVITSHRVMVRRGILSKTGKDITLGKITDVSFHQTLLDRVIRAGSLRIESAGEGPDEALNNIPNSQRVQQLINRLVDEDDLRRRQGGMPQGASFTQPAPEHGRAPEQRGYPEPGRGHGGRGEYDERGYDRGGYDDRGHDRGGYDERGYDERPYDQAQHGYDERYDRDAPHYERGYQRGYEDRGYDDQAYDDWAQHEHGRSGDTRPIDPR